MFYYMIAEVFFNSMTCIAFIKVSKDMVFDLIYRPIHVYGVLWECMGAMGLRYRSNKF